MECRKTNRIALYIWTLVSGILLSGAFADEVYLSPVALAVNADKVFIAEHTAKQVAMFDLVNNALMGAIPLAGQPSGLVLSPDGTLLYVTGGRQEGRIDVIDLADNKVIKSYPAGHSPTAPVIMPDGKALFVCKQFDDSVMALDLETGESVDIAVSREPVAAAITPDGARLLVANLLPATKADDDYISAVVDVIDTATKKKISSIALTNGSGSLHGICVSPDGHYAYVTHILSRYHLPTTQLARGWINTNAVSVIDIAALSLKNTFLLDDVDLGAANPWGIGCTSDGKKLVVAHSGAHEISVINREKLHEKLDAAEAAGESGTIPNELSFLVGIRERLKLLGKGPRGLAFAGDKIFAAEYFSGTLGIIEMLQAGKFAIASYPVGNEPPLSVVRAGELLFHDGSACFQQWQSCASCHPGNARVDGLNWDNLNDGMGNPKNTKNMLLSYDTPPTTVTGVRANAETSTRAGIRFMLFNQLPEEHAISIDEYLKSLEPVPSPKLLQGKLSPAAERGKELFDSAKCSVCHPAPLFTDMKKHRVGTNTVYEPTARFDTPTLVESWRTAPYLHDGRAVTIEEVLRNKEHGETENLSDTEISDLAEYVLSL